MYNTIFNPESRIGEFALEKYHTKLPVFGNSKEELALKDCFNNGNKLMFYHPKTRHFARFCQEFIRMRVS